MYREVVDKYSDHRNVSESLYSLNISLVHSAWDYGTSLHCMTLKCPWISGNPHTRKRVCILLWTRLLITKEKHPEAQRKHPEGRAIGLCARCQTRYKSTEVTDPHGSHSAPRKDTACGMNGRVTSPCWQCLWALWQGPSAALTAGSLPHCCAAHTFPSAHECGDIPPALLWDRGGLLDRGWGTTAQWGAEAGAAPPPWVTTASSMASCKLDPDVSGNREKEEPTENFHMFWVVFLAIKMLQHDHGQNPDLQGNV